MAGRPASHDQQPPAIVLAENWLATKLAVALAMQAGEVAGASAAAVTFSSRASL
jgi:hypothetical protein